jgi:hypothetical protein
MKCLLQFQQSQVYDPDQILHNTSFHKLHQGIYIYKSVLYITSTQQLPANAMVAYIHEGMRDVYMHANE